MKNIVRWDVAPCGSNITEDELQSRLAVKNGVFWDVTPYGFSKNRHFGGT
jgi:hypothetical protein